MIVLIPSFLSALLRSSHQACLIGTVLAWKMNFSCFSSGYHSSNCLPSANSSFNCTFCNCSVKERLRLVTSVVHCSLLDTICIREVHNLPPRHFYIRILVSRPFCRLSFLLLVIFRQTGKDGDPLLYLQLHRSIPKSRP